MKDRLNAGLFHSQPFRQTYANLLIAEQICR